MAVSITRSDLDWLLLVTFGAAGTERLPDSVAIRIRLRAERTGIFLHSLVATQRRPHVRGPYRARSANVRSSQHGAGDSAR